ncbi:MAG: isocitrate lyase/phosphoenolpyruvate mutase family protein [Hyphomonadaceae bacterium]|nr:isocitrate lyase/phosphoenolpyruvate mutase family protein [Hyphomonadaceae bacterium]
MPARPEAAPIFHRLHEGPDVLVLANVWDAFSAKLAADAGAKAIATSSAAVAWAHGYGDGHHLPTAKLIATIEEIARVVSIPITADVEGGYSDDPAQAGENIAAFIGAGAVGINLEDGTLAPDVLCRKIEAARKAGERTGVQLFINARTDVYLKQLATGEAALAETIRRGNLYREAGASGFFVPGPTDAGLLGTVVREAALPLNVMARKGAPALAELKQIGVRRLSAATAIGRAAYSAAQKAAAAFLQSGDGDALAEAAGPSVDYNKLFP